MGKKLRGCFGCWTPPSQLHFLSSLLPLHWKVVDGHVLHLTVWFFFKSTAERDVFFQWQCLSTPDTEHLKPEDRQPPKDVCPLWNTAIRGSRQELGKQLMNQWQVSRLHTQQELWWGFWHTLEFRLYKHWLVLMEPLPGEATTWLQGSLEKQRGDSHGKETPHIMLYTMNFCNCFTAFLYQLRKQCMGFLFCLLEKNMKEALKTLGRGIASCKKHSCDMEKTKLLSSWHLQSERWKNT